MDNTKMLARRDDRGGAFEVWKVIALIMLVLLMADVLTRQIGLLTHSASEPMPGTATKNFFKVQVGDFRAEIEWNNRNGQE